MNIVIWSSLDFNFDFRENPTFKDTYEYNKLKKDAFFIEPNDTIFGLSIGSTFGDAVGDFGKIPVTKPFVDVTFEDLDYVGACAVINVEALKVHLIDIGKLHR